MSEKVHKIYISERGNKKLKCPIFNLPTGITCKDCVECAKYCYAKKAERLYPQVRPCRMRNYEESLKDSFVENMIEAIPQVLYFRIHESGDYYSEEYVLKWYEIAKAFPKTTFFSYTKRDDVFTLELLEQKPNNFLVIYSLDKVRTSIEGLEVPPGFDKLALTHATDNNCPAIDDKSIKCMKHCFLCVTENDHNIIVFRKH